MPRPKEVTAAAKTIVPDLNYPPILPPNQDLSSLMIYYNGQPRYDIRENVVSAKYDLTTDGAHTVTIQVADVSRKLLRSGFLATHTDIRIFYTQHESWFRLMKVTKQGELLTLVFEDRHVQILKSFNKKLLIQKGTLTRCQFIWAMIIEAQDRDPKLDIIAPCVGTGKDKPKIVQSLDKSLYNITQESNPYTPAVPFKPSYKFNIKINGETPTKDQLTNINDILDVGAQLKARRKVLVVAIMVAIHESSIKNLPCVEKYGYCPDGPWGCFQQFRSAGWPASGNVRKDATAHFNHSIQIDHDNPTISYNDLANRAQTVHGYDFTRRTPDPGGGAYGDFRLEAERIVNAWGFGGEDVTKHVDPKATPSSSDPTKIPATTAEDPFAIPPGWTASSGDNASQQWHRGSPKTVAGRATWKKENSWDCMERMANEVHWYKFMVWDDLHFVPRDFFFDKAAADIEEFQAEIAYIDGDYDRNKMNGTVTINTFSDQWVWLPGQTLELKKMGPFDGNWMVTEVQGDLIGTSDCQVTLKKPIKPISEAAAEGGSGGSSIGLTGGELPGSKGKQPPAGVGPTGPAKDVACQILKYVNAGKIKFENSKGLQDIKDTCAGKEVKNPGGNYVNLDRGMLALMINLADQYGPIYISAVCSDHSSNDSDGMGGHWKGYAFDLSGFAGELIRNENGGSNTMPKWYSAVGRSLHEGKDFPGPPGIISSGWGNVPHVEAQVFCKPQFSYWDVTPQSHSNHFHLCFTPGLPS